MEETLGKRIVSHRKRVGLTQDQLAEKMGITAQAVSKWENDQSCPDISALPQLADIFDITVDALLGRETAENPAMNAHEPVYEAEVVDTYADPEFNHSDSKENTSHLEFSIDGGKKHYIGLAVWILSVGIFFLANVLCSWQFSFWEVLWPTSLLVFGIFHLYPKFSFLSLGCILVGSYAITSHFLPNSYIQDKRLLLAAILILLGISLLVDGIRKKRQKARQKAGHANLHLEKKFVKSLDIGDDAFDYDAAFGSDRARIDLILLREGDIDVSFGDYTVDLQGVENVAGNCRLDVDVSFGELTVLVPRRFTVNMHQDTSFSGVEVKGQPEDAPEGIVLMDADVSFGSLVIEYI